MRRMIDKRRRDAHEQSLGHCYPQSIRDHWQQMAVAGFQDGLWTRDLSSNVEWWSPRSYELLGYQEGEVDASHARFLEFIHPEDEPLVLEAIRSHIEDHKSYDLEFRMLTKQNEYRWFRSRGQTVRSKTGKPVWMSGSVRDITFRKRIEAELKQKGKLLDLVLSATTDGIWDWNVSTGRVFFSEQWFRSLGYEPGELPAHISSWEKVVHPDDMPRVREELELHFNRKKEVYEVENRLRMKSGEWRHNLDRGRVVQWDEDGKPLRMVGSDVDITKRREAEENISNLQLQLAHLSRTSAMAEMVAGLIHEVTQPVFAISNIADTCLHIIESGKVDVYEAVPHLQTILTETQRVNAILGCTRNFIRKRHPHFSRYDVNALLVEVEQLVVLEARRRAAIIEMRLENDLPMALCDRVQIQQLVLNLIRNSLDAVRKNAPENRRIVVSTQLEEGGSITIAVRDNGEGISPRNQERVFDPFFTTKEDGLGMGLAVSASLAKAHHGSLTMKSNSDSGVTVSLTLPCRPISEQMRATRSKL